MRTIALMISFIIFNVFWKLVANCWVCSLGGRWVGCFGGLVVGVILSFLCFVVCFSLGLWGVYFFMGFWVFCLGVGSTFVSGLLECQLSLIMAGLCLEWSCCAIGSAGVWVLVFLCLVPFLFLGIVFVCWSVLLGDVCHGLWLVLGLLVSSFAMVGVVMLSQCWNPLQLLFCLFFWSLRWILILHTWKLLMFLAQW